MIEWLASGIPAAVEASGPRFLPTMIQLLLFGGGAFAGGLFFGRFWLTRIIQTKEAELASEVRRYEAQSERLLLLADQVAQFKEDIANAQNLEEAKETAKDIPSVDLMKEDSRKYANRYELTSLIRKLSILRRTLDKSNREIAADLNIPYAELIKITNRNNIDLNLFYYFEQRINSKLRDLSIEA